MTSYYTEIFQSCGKIPIVDLWDSDKPGTGLNGTGPDHYEEALFEERLMQIINNYDSSTPPFLYYPAHLVHAPPEAPDRYVKKFNFIDDQRHQIYIVQW